MSTTSETRREAHEFVIPRKHLRYQEILDILAAYGPMTAEEVTERLVQDGKIPAFDQNAARPRLTELKQSGRVEVIGKRESRRSGRKTALWAIKQASAGSPAERVPAEEELWSRAAEFFAEGENGALSLHNDEAVPGDAGNDCKENYTQLHFTLPGGKSQ